MSEHHHFPAWYYGPNDASQIFQSAEEVPAGWQDHPSKVKIVSPDVTGSKPAATPPDATSTAQRGAGPANPGDVSNTLDRDGHAWDANLHAKTKSLTKDGLWRLKVGASRPAPAPGYPKPPLDL